MIDRLDEAEAAMTRTAGRTRTWGSRVDAAGTA
jgi:hypothetical protein